MKRGSFLGAMPAIAVAVVPIALVWIVAADISAITIPAAFKPNAEHYPEAIERLESTSQMLVTVTLATLGAAGFLLMNNRSALNAAAAFAIFGCSVLSLYYATKLGFYAAVSLAADQGDIVRIAPLLDNQAIAALVAGLMMGGMAMISGMRATAKNRNRPKCAGGDGGCLTSEGRCWLMPNCSKRSWTK